MTADCTRRKGSALEIALALIARGFHIIPLKPAVLGNPKTGKQPSIQAWQDAGSTDPAQARTWFANRPHANVGIVTGGRYNLLVIDVDPGHGGLESLNAMRAEGLVPALSTVKTGGGGEHMYFRCSASQDYTGTVGKLGAGIDVRSRGNQVVAPGSLHHSGGLYEWIGDGPIYDLDDYPKLIKRLEAGSGGKAQSLRAGHAPNSRSGAQNVPEGSRNGTLFREACRLHHLGWCESEILEHTLIVNERRCNPPLDDSEVEGLVSSATRYQTTPDLTEQDLADLLVERIAGYHRFVPGRGEGWRYFDGTVWKKDGAGARVQEHQKAMVVELKQYLTMDTSQDAADSLKALARVMKATTHRGIMNRGMTRRTC